MTGRAPRGVPITDINKLLIDFRPSLAFFMLRLSEEPWGEVVAELWALVEVSRRKNEENALRRELGVDLVDMQQVGHGKYCQFENIGFFA